MVTMPRTVAQVLKDQYRRMDHLQGELHRLEREAAELETLRPFTFCPDCGAEAEGGVSDAKANRCAAQLLGKKTMVCPWCDRLALIWWQVKQYSKELALPYGTERHAQHAADYIVAVLANND